MIIPVKTDTINYDVVIEEGALAKAGQLINLNRKVLVVTDSGVPAEYAKTVLDQCKDGVLFTIPQGEQSKCIDVWQQLLAAMLDADFTRKDCVVAVGGGMCGDLAGFAAASFMRGIEFFNMPTTLLSQVDSSIGGKTGIDFHNVKNIVGAFYQPSMVIVDPKTLDTLSDRLFMAGLTEAIKMAANFDLELFEFIEKSEDIRKDASAVIAGALKIKERVVEEDTKEAGVRSVLNFGHTIGHAIEAVEEYNLYHGECVALGMIPMSSPEVRERLLSVFAKYNIPTTHNHKPEELLPYILHDKKKSANGIKAVLCEKLGTYTLKQMDPEEILKRMETI
ncbi:MAG: 3-dehydroquinate synthase [Clostridia bacterium]|nr:3-dehydroquinate synthase [Clostridia bacterium]